MTISVKTFIGVSLNEHSGVMLPLDEARELRDALDQALAPFAQRTYTFTVQGDGEPETRLGVISRTIEPIPITEEPEPCTVPQAEPIPITEEPEPEADDDPDPSAPIAIDVKPWEQKLLDDWHRLRGRYDWETDAAIVGRMVGAFVKSHFPELKGMLSEDIRQNLRRLGVTVADPMPRNERGSIGGQKFRQMCAEAKPEPEPSPNKAEPEPSPKPTLPPTVAQMIEYAPTPIPGKLTESIQALKCLASDGWTPGRIARELRIGVDLISALADRAEGWLADYRRLSMGDKNDVMAGVLKRWKEAGK